MAQTYFASIQPGLEQALFREIRRLGGKRPSLVHGGVEFDAARKTLYAAHLHLSTPTRIWLRVDEFRARDAPELYNKTRRYGWERLLGAEHRVAIRAHSSKSNLYHTEKITDAVRDGLRDHFADDLCHESPPTFGEEGDEGAQLLMARIHDNRCQLSLDASGALLHRRGWRTEAGPAPLRESIAAAMLELIDWSPEFGLIDPMCGSATIAIEAARRALNYPPGLDRSFSFQSWRNFQPHRFQEMKDEAKARIRSELPAPIVGRDRDPGTIALATRNAARASVGAALRLEVADLADAPITEDLRWIVTNPPYGERLQEEGIIESLLSAWRCGTRERQIAFLWPTARRDVVEGADDALGRLTSFKNGGLAVDLWTSA